MKFLARLDGTQPQFSSFELLTLLQQRIPGVRPLARKGRFLYFSSRKDAGTRDLQIHKGLVEEVSGELALCHSITLVLRELDRGEFLAWLSQEEDSPPVPGLSELWVELLSGKGHDGSGSEIPGFRVDCHFAITRDRQRELYLDPSVVRLTRERLGGLLLEQAQGRARVDLHSPKVILTVFLGERVSVGITLPCNQRSLFQERKVGKRPFFSPISLEPRWARASVNLLGLEPPATIYDPFCGTGGILLEAGLLGHRMVGSDLAQRMVKGTKQNLEHFGLEPLQLFQADIGICGAELEARGLKVDGVVSDLPYGRASSLAREDRNHLYARAFKAISGLLSSGSPALLILPDPKAARLPGEHGLRLVGIFPVYIHRSLTRYFCLYQKE